MDEKSLTWCSECNKDVGIGYHGHCPRCGEPTDEKGHYVISPDFEGFTCDSSFQERENEKLEMEPSDPLE